MTRKDTILVAVVINAGLLALLFAAAVIYDTEKIAPSIQSTGQLVQNQKPSQLPPKSLVATNADDKESVIKYYAAGGQESGPELHEENEFLTSKPRFQVKDEKEEEEDLPLVIAPKQKENHSEVVVKRGDVLEKIAKANGTTVRAIKKANQLDHERLNVGQVLKMPAAKDVTVAQSTETPTSNVKKQPEKSVEAISEPVYYTVKSGDSPWKIAKQMNVKYEDILKLNQLDEDKARNLKIGDRIRVK